MMIRRLSLALISFLALIAIQSTPNRAAIVGNGVITATPPPVNQYFASPTGNDANPGTQAQPWATTGKVNSFVFPAASTINLDGGNGVFSGCLVFNQVNAPGGITIKPYNGSTFELDATCSGTNSNGLVIDSVSNVTLQDCVVRGNAGGVWNGIEVTNTINNATVATQHITVQRCNVSGFYRGGSDGGNEILVSNLSHNIVDDINILNNTLGGSAAIDPDACGICGFAYNADAPVTNVTYLGNKIQNLGGTTTFYSVGITVDGVVGANVQGNTLHDIGGNSQQCGGPGGIVSYNADNAHIWENEVYNVQPISYVAGCDWVGIDFDGGTTNSVMELNYTHHNAGTGLYLFAIPGGRGTWGNNVIRYNVSENDDSLSNNGTLGAIQFSANGINNGTFQIYGNTVYLSNPNTTGPAGTTQSACFAVTSYANPQNSPGIGSTFFDNICAMNKDAGGFDNFIAGIPGYNPTNITFATNQYFDLNGGTFRVYRWDGTSYASLAAWQTAIGSDVGSITTDPLFVGPVGTNVTCGGLANPPTCPSGYKLSNGSPAFGKGFRPDKPPFSQTTPQDYYGDTLPPATSKAASIGAFYGVPTSDSTAPSVAITVPSSGATITSAVTLTATCSDNDLCQSVQFVADGNFNINAAVLNTGGTYSTRWQPPAQFTGSHTLTAIGYDRSGNATTSAGIPITVTLPLQFYLSGAGSDTYDGLFPAHTTGTHGPWLTTAPTATATFAPGTVISFDRANGPIVGCFRLSWQTNVTAATNLTVNTYGTGTGDAVIHSNCPGSLTVAVLVDGIANFTWDGVDISANGTDTTWGLVYQNSLGGVNNCVPGTNFAPPCSPIQNVTIKNSDISGFHDIIDGTTDQYDGGEIIISSLSIFGGNQYSGIPSTCIPINNVLITNNKIHGASGPTSPDSMGIGSQGCGSLWGPPGFIQSITNVEISHNEVYDIGGLPGGVYAQDQGNGIVPTHMDTVTAEFNLVHDIGGNNTTCGGGAGLWFADVNRGLIQFNEVYYVRYLSAVGPSACDSNGMGFDGWVTNSVLQYNYSHDNSGPGIYTCGGYCAYGPLNGKVNWGNNIIRYNVLQNNTSGTIVQNSNTSALGEINIGGSGPTSGRLDIYNNSIFNNVSYNPATNQFAPCIWRQGLVPIAGVVANNACELSNVGPFNLTTFYQDQNDGVSGLILINNDWYNAGTGNSQWTCQGQGYNQTNGGFPAFAAACGFSTTGSIVTNPLFAGAPRTGACGGLVNPPGCPAEYKLSGGSPASGSGLDLTQSPYNLVVGPVDYFGDTIPAGGGTGYSIGAYGTASGCTIISVNLTNNTFPGGAASGTVIGTISATKAGSTCNADSFSLTGTDAASFQITGGTTLKTNGTVAGGTYHINIVDTVSGATGSPFSQAETITGTSGLVLGNKAHSNSAAATITTASTAGVLVACVTNNASSGDPGLAVSSSTLGAWTQRAKQGSQFSVSEFYAPFSSLLTGEVVTFAPATGSSFVTIDVFEVESSTAFDTNGSLPATGPVDPINISTTNSGTFDYGCARMGTTASPTQGSGWTKISGADYQLVEYQINNAIQTNLPVTIGTGVGDSNGIMGDALK